MKTIYFNIAVLVYVLVALLLLYVAFSYLMGYTPEYNYSINETYELWGF